MDTTADTPMPILIDAKRAAALCGVSARHWATLDSEGLIPAPVRLGRRVLWRRAELGSWVAAGCPPRLRWQEKQEERA
ncbi:MAG: DNA-binding protein [Planctomycetota bacterium]